MKNIAKNVTEYQKFCSRLISHRVYYRQAKQISIIVGERVSHILLFKRFQKYI